MRAKHTPGPWHISEVTIAGCDIDAEYKGIGGDELVATAYAVYRAGGDDKANARLIAAAPDLLEAVRVAIPGYITTGEASYDRLLALCRAYKKATGERHPADRWTEATA